MSNKLVIFLDFDGVLNREKFYVERYGSWKRTGKLTRTWYNSIKNIDAKCVHQLKRIIKETGAEIVVSSSWRYDLDLCKNVLKYHGIENTDNIDRTGKRGQWIESGLTKEDFTYCYDNWKFEPEEPRGLDIQVYLNNHPEVDNYVILDDDNDFANHQIPHFVFTWKNGLDEEMADKAIEILKNKELYLK